MRLKTFTAPTIAQALQQVRAELGEDAIIVSTESGRGGARLVAALDFAEADGDDPPFSAASEAVDDAQAPPERCGEDLRAALLWHGVPASLVERLLRAAAPHLPEPAAALAAALDAALTFQPLGDPPAGRPIILVGPPGMGKTLMAAKLIVDAHRRGRQIVAASCDTRRAGGYEQLEVFARILALPLVRIEEVAELTGIATAAAKGSVAIIDSAGCSPFSDSDLRELEQQIEAADAEPVLVFAAGSDAAEASEVAAAFARLGCRRMIATRLDVSRRLGGLSAAAVGGRLALAGASISPHAADPPAPISPLSLAKLILSIAPATSSTFVSEPAPGRKARR